MDFLFIYGKYSLFSLGNYSGIKGFLSMQTEWHLRLLRCYSHEGYNRMTLHYSPLA